MNRKTVLVTLGSTVAAVWLGAGITYAAKFADRPTLGASAPTTVATVPLIAVPAATTTTTTAAPVTTTTAAPAAPAPTTVASAAPVRVAATVATVTTEQPATTATTAPPETVPATTTTTTAAAAPVSPPSTGSLDYVAFPQEPSECSVGGYLAVMDDQKGNARLLPNPNTVWTFKSVVIDGQPAPAPSLEHAGAMAFYPISYTVGWKVMVSIKLLDGRDCLAGTMMGGVN